MARAMQPPEWMEPWTQPSTAPRQPDVEGDPSIDARVDRHRWIAQPPVARPRPVIRRRRMKVIDVFSALVVIAFLVAVVVALPMLLLGLL